MTFPATTSSKILASNYNEIQAVAQEILGRGDDGYGLSYLNSNPVGLNNLCSREDFNNLFTDLNNIHIHITNTSTSTLSLITNPYIDVTTASINALKELSDIVLPRRYQAHPGQYYLDPITGNRTNFGSTSTRTLSWGINQYSIYHDTFVWFPDRLTARYFFNFGSYLTFQIYHGGDASGGVNDEWKNMINYVSGELETNKIIYDRSQFIAHRPGGIVLIRSYSIAGLTIDFYIYKYSNEKDFLMRTTFQDARSPWLTITPNPGEHKIEV